MLQEIAKKLDKKGIKNDLVLYIVPEAQSQKPKAKVEHDKNISEHSKRIRTKKERKQKAFLDQGENDSHSTRATPC